MVPQGGASDPALTAKAAIDPGAFLASYDFAASYASAPHRFGRSINVAQLVFGFGVGQGSVFLAQTWLVHSHQLELLGQFGTMFSFATLATLIVDMGGLTTLARRVAHPSTGADRLKAIWQAYWAITAGRILVGFAIVVAALIVALTAGHPFTAGYVIAAAPALVIWAFNAAGILDGLRRSGFSGIALSFPYIASACALLLVGGEASFVTGAMLGAAFTVGSLLSVAVHLFSLRAFGFAMRFVRPESGSVFRAAREGMGMLVFSLPAQVFFRIQILLCGFLLGPAMTGLFVYAKQITNALGQVVGFMRRVEFPTLVYRLALSSQEYLARTFQILGGALLAAATAAAGVAAFALLARPHLSGGLANAALIVAWFSPVVLSGAVAQTLSQGFLAMGRLTTVALTANLAMLVGILLSFTAPRAFGLPGFVLAEVTMHLIIVVLMLIAYRRIADREAQTIGA